MPRRSDRNLMREAKKEAGICLKCGSKADVPYLLCQRHRDEMNFERWAREAKKREMQGEKRE